MRWGWGLWLVLLAGHTAQQVPVWASSRSLWTHAVAVTPSPRAVLNLSAATLPDDCAAAARILASLSGLDPPSCVVYRSQRDWLTAFCPSAPAGAWSACS